MTSPSELLLSHPKLHLMKSYGFNNPSQMFAALLVYLDLTEVKQWCSVDIASYDPLQVITLTAKKSEDDHLLHILPLPTNTELSMERISTYFNALPANASQLTLGLVDSDSTIVYYQLSSGLSPPHSSSLSQKK